MVFLANDFLLKYYILSTLLFLLLYVLSVYIKTIKIYNNISCYLFEPDKSKRVFSMISYRLLAENLLDLLFLLLPVFRVFCIVLFYATIGRESRNISETIILIVKAQSNLKKNQEKDQKKDQKNNTDFD